MKSRGVVIGGVLILLSTVAGTRAAQQSPGGMEVVRSIDVSNSRPILRAVEALRERYHVAITYEDPRYVYAQDIGNGDFIHKGPLASRLKAMVPRGGTIHFEYTEVNGKPREDMASLIGRLLAQHAAQGGPIFEVRESTTSGRQEWNVVASKARDEYGTFVAQPDILGARISVPKALRSEADLLVELLQQVRTETGYRVVLGIVQSNLQIGTGELGADNVSARDVLFSLFGTSMVWDLTYDPERAGTYVLNLVWTPLPAQPVSPYTQPRTPHTVPTGPPIGAAMHMATTHGGITHIQSLLGQTGYFGGEPSGVWDYRVGLLPK